MHLRLTELEQTLRPIARQRIDNGLLPRDLPGRFWGGKKTGYACALCDQTIEPAELEYEIE